MQGRTIDKGRNFRTTAEYASVNQEPGEGIRPQHGETQPASTARTRAGAVDIETVGEDGAKQLRFPGYLRLSCANETEGANGRAVELLEGTVRHIRTVGQIRKSLLVGVKTR